MEDGIAIIFSACPSFIVPIGARKAIIGLHVDGIAAYLNDSEPEPFR